jgi:probable HAF family extracellular repeat protein
MDGDGEGMSTTHSTMPIALLAAAAILGAAACGQEQLKPKPIPQIYCTGAWQLVALGTLASGGAAGARFASGVIGVGGSRAHGIGPDGTVVGTSDTDDEWMHAFFWQAGDISDLFGGHNTAVARSVNAAGEIVGSLDEDNAFYADLAGAGALLPGLGGKTVAFRINEIGQTAGYSTRLSAGGGSSEHAVVWGSPYGAPYDLGLAEGFSRAHGLNDLGAVVGFFELATGERHAFLVTHVLRADPALHDLGTLGGTNSSAYAVSDTEPPQVVGEADTADGLVHAFWSTLGTSSAYDFGALPGGNTSSAVAINRLGGAVGFSNTDPDGPAAGMDHATLFGCEAGPKDLNDLVADAAQAGWVLTEANDINDAFQIAGTAVDPDGNTIAFLLDPPAMAEQH